MPRKRFIQTTFMINEDEDDDWSFLQTQGQMNSNIFQIKKNIKRDEK